MKPHHLPRRIDDLAGLRAARWIRESSAKQGDRYGPGAQRSMQDQAIERYGLADTGLSWTVLKSGWSGADSMDDPPATRTADFQEMLHAAEAGRYDVLLVGYTSRFLRDMTMSLNYRRFFHRNGVVILICDDRILTSDPDDWERLVDRIKADEVYSRNLGRNIRTGLAEKRRSMGDPGGQPPLGYRREAKLLVVDPSSMPTVERAFALSASGLADNAVADAVGVTLDTVRHVLTNPVYIGRLTDGLPFRLGAAVGMDTWNLVQARREKRRTRVPGVSQRQCFALKLVCGYCELTLHGHNGRYRHARPVCARFAAAQPRTAAVRGRHAASAGTSYPTHWFEAIIELLLEGIAITDEAVIQNVVAGLKWGREQTVDQVSLARIGRARSEALRRLEDTRDVETWKVTVSRLDAEEAAARAPSSESRVVSDAAIRSYLGSIGSLWRKADAASRQGMALALFDSLAARGFQELHYQWSATAKAYGLDRIVPQVMTVDLATLGLRGSPLGTFVIRSQAPRRIRAALEAAG